MLNFYMHFNFYLCFFPIVFCPTLSQFKVGLSPSKKICVICYDKSSLKMIKNTFYFILKAHFELRVYKFFLDAWSYRKNGLIRRIRLILKSFHNLVIKQLKYTYFPIFHKVKRTGPWSLFNRQNISEIFFFKNHAQNESGRLV